MSTSAKDQNDTDKAPPDKPVEKKEDDNTQKNPPEEKAASASKDDKADPKDTKAELDKGLSNGNNGSADKTGDKKEGPDIKSTPQTETLPKETNQRNLNSANADVTPSPAPIASSAATVDNDSKKPPESGETAETSKPRAQSTEKPKPDEAAIKDGPKTPPKQPDVDSSDIKKQENDAKPPVPGVKIEKPTVPTESDKQPNPEKPKSPPKQDDKAKLSTETSADKKPPLATTADKAKQSPPSSTTIQPTPPAIPPRKNAPSPNPTRKNPAHPQPPKKTPLTNQPDRKTPPTPPTNRRTPPTPPTSRRPQPPKKTPLTPQPPTPPSRRNVTSSNAGKRSSSSSRQSSAERPPRAQGPKNNEDQTVKTNTAQATNGSQNNNNANGPSPPLNSTNGDKTNNKNGTDKDKKPPVPSTAAPDKQSELNLKSNAQEKLDKTKIPKLTDGAVTDTKTTKGDAKTTGNTAKDAKESNIPKPDTKNEKTDTKQSETKPDETKAGNKDDKSKTKANEPAANTAKSSKNDNEGNVRSEAELKGGPLDPDDGVDKPPPTRLLSLAQKGEWTILETALRTMDKGNPQVFVVDKDTGVTPLMLAVRENRLVVAERLVDLGAPINHQAADNRTALHYAASYSRDDIVKLLLNRKADASIVGGPKDQMALHMACGRASGVVPTVQLLLRSSGKESRLAEDKEGSIPVFLAAEVGNTAVCRELLQHLTEHQIHSQKKDNGDSVLHLACHRKDIDMTKLFVESGAVIDIQNHEGQTPLHIAAYEGDEGIVKYLHQVKANPNIIDTEDRSPLHIASERGHTTIVEILVDKFRANVSARTKDGSTLMHIASQYGHPDTALAFLKKGVPMLMPNKSGAICLHAAAMKGHTSVIKALLTKGAPVDAMTKDGYTALHLSVQHSKPLAVQTLLGYGAAVELKGGQVKETPLHIAARTEEGEKCAEMLLKSGADVNATKENGETALHIAGRYGHLQMVCALLAEGADPTWQSKSGETPLHIAVRYCHWEVGDEILRFVKKERSSIDATMLVNAPNVEGETAVHYAAELTKKQAHHEFEDTDMITLLLQNGGDTNIHTKLTQETPIHYCARAGNADVMLEIVKHLGPNQVQVAVNKQAKNGWSPLLVASEQGHLDILKILLQHHARVDVFDEHGKAALHLSAENGHEEVADVLLQHKAFVNAKSKLGLTPLHLASQSGYNKLARLLIDKHGATTDALSLAKKTPLHLAAQTGQIEVCGTLLKMKADANAKDSHSQTPLHLAAENDHSDVVKLFLKHRPELVSMANTNGLTCAHIAASKGSVAVLKELMKSNKSVIATARTKNTDSTTLHLAAAGGHAHVIKVLLEAGASATDENAEGMTAIHLSAKNGHVNVLEALKDHVSFRVTSTKTGLTALHVAAQHGQIDFVREMLIKVPATVQSEPPHTDGPMRELGTAEFGLTPLHLAAQSGHEGLVRLLLNSPGVQADAATAVQGVIPLHLAAQSGHTAVVSLLLSKSTKLLHIQDKRGRTGLHLAASNGHLDMLSLLLGQGADINGYDKNGWTPLHYAAKAGHLDVVKLLCDAGANPSFETKDNKVPICFAAGANHEDVVAYLLQKEHNTYNLMDDRKWVFDLMALGKANDNKSIQEFILVSPAPVDTAVKMSRAFRNLSTKEKERAKDLLSAGDFCEMMATELNAIAASVNGPALLLKSVDNRGMPLLDILIECEQKEVVADAVVQRYLSEVWTGYLSHWGSVKMLLLFCVLLFVPPVWLAFSLPNRHIRFNKVPVIKFMLYLVSHIYLVVLLILTVVYPLNKLWESSNLIPHWYEWLLLAWMSGLLVNQLTNPEDRQGLGWIKVIIIAICNFGVTTHLFAFLYTGDDRLYCLYARNQFFGLSLMLCFVQLLDFLSFHHLFGPWAIIIRDLMKDLTRFLVILAIFMLGFTLQLAAIYQPVLAPLIPEPDKGTGDGSGGAGKETPLSTFELLFFALFGLVDPENLPLVNRSPLWSITLAKTVFGCYLTLTIIVLINLLIAMMSDTYQRIQAQSDTEWKFGRAKLFRNMNKTSATPSPLNLFTKLYVYITILIKHKSKVCSLTDVQQYIDEEEELDQDSGNIGGGAGGQNWRNVMRRNTQVAPEVAADFLQAALRNGPTPVEEVVDWKVVADRYLHLKGFTDGNANDSDKDDDEDAFKGNEAAPEQQQ